MWKGEIQSDGLKLEYQITKKVVSVVSKYQKIDVLQTLEHGKLLLLDDLVMLNEREEFTYHEMLVHVPFFFHTNPKKILIIGGGDGGTVRECLKHPVASVTLCEIDEKVISVSKKHLECGKFLKNKKLKIVVGDGMKFLKDSKTSYDIILVDGTDPIGPGKILFSKEFCKLVRDHLNPGGLYCTQSESPFGKYKKNIVNFHHTLSAIFHYSKIYGVSIPMYPSGYWCFAISSLKTPKFNKKSYDKLHGKLKCKYYNSEIHHSCFSLPEFVKVMLKG